MELHPSQPVHPCRVCGHYVLICLIAASKFGLYAKALAGCVNVHNSHDLCCLYTMKTPLLIMRLKYVNPSHAE